MSAVEYLRQTWLAGGAVRAGRKEAAHSERPARPAREGTPGSRAGARFVAVSLLAAALTFGAATDPKVAHAEDAVSGLAAGTPTPSIPVVDVTGPYKGKRICYVCEFQDEPNVLAFLRDTDDAAAELIVAFNDLYVRNKDRGLKAVVMIVAGPEASPWLEQLAADRKLEVPLTVFRKGPADVAARLYELDPEVPNAFLVTRNRFVVSNVAGIGPAEFDRVDAAATAMLASPE